MQNSPISILTDSRCRDLGITKVDLVRRMHYRNIPKGLKRLDALLAGASRHDELTTALASALELPVETVADAVVATRQAQADCAHEQWVRDFKPHAFIETECGGRPKQLVVAGLAGAMDWLVIRFPEGLAERDYLAHARSELDSRKARIMGMFSEPTSVVIYAHSSGGRRYRLDGAVAGEVDGPVKAGRLALRI